MNIIHIVVGEENAKPILESIANSSESNESVFTLKDCLNIGILKTDSLHYSENRNAIGQILKPNQKAEYIDDLANLMQISSRLSNGEECELLFWMSTNAEDVCAYYWLLHFLKKHQGKLALINISGLPFLNDEMQLFYPKTIAALPLKQIIKAQKLKRVITTSEWETEGEEWKKMGEENAEIRYVTNGKSLMTANYDFYDTQIESALNQNLRLNKIIQEFTAKYHFSFSAISFLQWRIAELKKSKS